MASAGRRPLDVDPRDSLRSLVVRGCRRRHLPHTWIIAERVGLRSRNRANFAHSPQVDVQELARLLEIPVDDVVVRRHEAVGNGRLNYWGLAVPALLLETAHRRRFAPGAFGSGAMPIHDTRWDMRLLPFCPTTWEMLEQSCGCCGRAQQWTVANGVDRCDNLHCVASLTRTKPRSVPTVLHERLSLAAGLSSPHPAERAAALARMPDLSHLDEQQAFDLLALVTTLARAARSGSFRISGPNTDGVELLECLTEACDILLDWPTRLTQLNIAAHRLPSAERASFTVSIRRIASEELARNLPSSIIDTILGALGGRSSERTGSGPGIDDLSGMDSVVGVRPAAEAAGTNRITMETAWKDGLVTRLHRSHGTKQVPAFLLSEAADVGRAMRARVSASGVAFRLGLPLYGVEQLACMQTLPADGLRLSTDWDRHFFIDADIDAFVDRIRHSATPTAPDDPLNLLTGLGTIPGMKPWGPTIAALLAGMPFHIVAGDRPIFHRILVDRKECARLYRMEFDHAEWPHLLSTEMTLGDALELLNLSWTQNDVVFTKPIVGTMPKRIAMTDILDLATTYVSTAELAARHRKSPYAICRTLKNAGFVQPYPGCWIRRDAGMIFG